MSNIEAAAQQIAKMSEGPQAKISEREFVSKWLLTLREYIAGGEVQIGIWLQENDITTFNEVAVVDPAGETLFIVPSILMTQDKLLPDAVSSDITDILYRADTMSQVMPGRGNQFIRNEITSKIKSPGTMEHYQQRWDAIFLRYELEPVFSATATNVSNSTDDGDFDEYEEL